MYCVAKSPQAGASRAASYLRYAAVCANRAKDREQEIEKENKMNDLA